MTGVQVTFCTPQTVEKLEISSLPTVFFLYFEIELVYFHYGGRASNGTAPTNSCGSGAVTRMNSPLVLFEVT